MRTEMEAIGILRHPSSVIDRGKSCTPTPSCEEELDSLTRERAEGSYVELAPEGTTGWRHAASSAFPVAVRRG